MASLNKATLIGRLGRDPESSHMTNGDMVTKFSIATSETWKDKNGERQEKTEWHNIIMYRGLAEIAAKYLNKGSMVYIEGRIETKKWKSKEGEEKTGTSIIASEMKMLGDKPSSSGSSHREEREKAPAPKRQEPKTEDFDDDIPF